MIDASPEDFEAAVLVWIKKNRADIDPSRIKSIERAESENPNKTRVIIKLA